MALKCHQCDQMLLEKEAILGGSLGLVVMGGDSSSEGRGFKSQHHILDGHLSHVFVVKL